MGYSKQFMHEISNSCRSWEDSSPYEGDSDDTYPCDKCGEYTPIYEIVINGDRELCSECDEEALLEDMEEDEDEP